MSFLDNCPSGRRQAATIETDPASRWSANASLPAWPWTMREIYDQSLAQTSFTPVMLAIAASMASEQLDQQKSAQYFQEADGVCTGEGGRLCGVSRGFVSESFALWTHARRRGRAGLESTSSFANAR